MNFIGFLRTLEQLSRPPRMGHDVDVEDGAEQTECLVPGDFNAVCRCVACVAEEQASAVEYDDDPSPTIVQSAPPPTVDGEGPSEVSDIPASPSEGRATSELLMDAISTIVAGDGANRSWLIVELQRRAKAFEAIED